MNTRGRRLLSWLLAVTMLFSLFPTTAFAETAGAEPEELAFVEEYGPTETEVYPEDGVAAEALASAQMEATCGIAMGPEKQLEEIHEEPVEEGEEAHEHVHVSYPWHDWRAALTVSFDRDIAADSLGLSTRCDSSFEGGVTGWHGFLLDQDLPAGAEVELFGSFGDGLSYGKLCDELGEILCGVFNLSEENLGAEMTVSLRLYEQIDGAETGYTETIASCRHTIAQVAQLQLAEELTAQEERVSADGEEADLLGEDPAADTQAQQWVVALTSRTEEGGTSSFRLSGGGRYEDGETVTVTAYPRTGYAFVGWFDSDDNSLENPLSDQQSYTFTVNRDFNLLAVYRTNENALFRLTVHASRYRVNNGAMQSDMSTYTYNVGERMYLSFQDADKQFLYWVNASGNILSTEKDYSFFLAADTEITAYFVNAESADDSATVIFRNAYQQVLLSRTYHKGQTISFPRNAPNKMGYTFKGWYLADENGEPTAVEATQESIHAAMGSASVVVVVPDYVPNGQEYWVELEYTDGTTQLKETETFVFAVGDSRTFTAPAIEGKVFQYWTMNGVKASYNTSIDVISAQPGTMTLQAVYGETEVMKEPLVLITQTFTKQVDDKYYISNTMKYYAPEEFVVMETGFVYSKNAGIYGAADGAEKLVLEAEDTSKHVTGFTSNAGNYTLNVRNTDPNQVLFIKAYMICKAPDGQVLTLYTDMRSGSFNSLSGHEHTWGEWTQTTAPTCTEAGEETRTCTECGGTETRQVAALGHDLVHHDAKAATCTEIGWEAYDTCSRCDYTTYEEIPATGHNWNAPTYEWAEGNSSVTATRTCSNDTAHIETETANTTSEVTKPATCEAEGETTYTATFANAAFETQTKVETIAALGHSWGEPIYTWAADNSTVMATRICETDSNHTETETVAANWVEEKAATCEEPGIAYYLSEIFSNPAFQQQRKNVAYPALGHNWGTANYEWADDYSTVTATRSCSNDPSHEESETVDTVAEVARPATCTAMGTTTYTAVFTNEAFTAQIQTVENIPFAAHTPGEAVRENEVPATCAEAGGYDEVIYCTVCGAQLSRETRTIEKLAHTPGEAVRENEVPATCFEAGSYDEVKYCTVCGEEISRTAKTIEKTAHTPASPVRENEYPATCTEGGSYEEVVYCTVCNEELSRTPKTIDPLPHHLTPYAAKEATCTEEGNTAYWFCSSCGKYFGDAEGRAEIEENSWTTPALGHTSGEPVRENEVPATCDAEGSYDEVVYCTVCGTELRRETKVIPTIAHDWDEGRVTTEPTCTTEGEKTYTCTVCGETKIEVIAALGHNLTAHEAVAATCETAGNNTYWSCEHCGKYFSDAAGMTEIAENSWVIPATGHAWGEPTWTWAEDNSAATATFTCTNNSGHTHTETATGDAATSTAGTGDNLGYTVYTATVTFEGKDYTDTKRGAAITCTITYDLGEEASLEEGKTNPESYTVESETITLNNPTREGYAFAGWTGTELDAATENVTIAKGSTGDRSYTATWNPIVTFDANFIAEGATKAATVTQVWTSETTKLTSLEELNALNDNAKAFTHEGFDFTGWNTEEDGAGTAYADEQEVTITEPLTLYAQWAHLEAKFDTVFPNTDTYLYRVGNGNTVKLSSLLELLEGKLISSGQNVAITVESADSETSAALQTYAKNDTWGNATLKFSGEGPVKVTIQEKDGDQPLSEPYTLNLEVVNGNNETSAKSATNTNIVLLNDVSTTGISVSGGHTLYGNGFTLTDTRDVNTQTLKWDAAVTVGNGTIDNLQIIGYTATTQNVGQYNTPNYAPVVKTNANNTIIFNTYVYGGRYPVHVDGGELLLKNSTLDGGAIANMLISTGSITIEDSQTTTDTRGGFAGLTFDCKHMSSEGLVCATGMSRLPVSTFAPCVWEYPA